MGEIRDPDRLPADVTGELPRLLVRAFEELVQQAEFWQKPIGSGPFKVEEAKFGDFSSFVPFVDYYEGKPKIDQIIAWASSDGSDGVRMPGAQSRWSAGKDLSWEPLRVERVCEVKYDHLQGDRFRHAAVFQRWRPDRQPEDCRYDQLEVTTAYELEKVFGAVRTRD